MSAPVLLNLLNKMRKKIRCEALPSIVLLFLNKLNKFNNSGDKCKILEFNIIWH